MPILLYMFTLTDVTFICVSTRSIFAVALRVLFECAFRNIAELEGRTDGKARKVILERNHIIPCLSTLKNSWRGCFPTMHGEGQSLQSKRKIGQLRHPAYDYTREMWPAP